MATDPAALLERARRAGVTRFLVPGTTLADSETAAVLAAAHGTSSPRSASIRTRRRTSIPSGTGPRSRRSRGARRSSRSARSASISTTTTRRGTSRSRSWSGCSTARGRLRLPVLLHNRESAEMPALLARRGAGSGPASSTPSPRTRSTAEGDRSRLPRVLLRHDHVSRGREHPRGRGRPAARVDAGRDRHAVSRARAPPRQALRARLRRRDGEEARRGPGTPSLEAVARATTDNFHRLFEAF